MAGDAAGGRARYAAGGAVVVNRETGQLPFDERGVERHRDGQWIVQVHAAVLPEGVAGEGQDPGGEEGGPVSRSFLEVMAGEPDLSGGIEGNQVQGQAGVKAWAAASGSTCKLNSASAVVLPGTSTAPP